MKINRYRYVTLLLMFIFLFLGNFVSHSFAVNHYIRPGATGNNSGSDWTNAWTQHPSSWIRGDTYYYADGVIDSRCIISAAENGNTRIFVKKATVQDHGTDVGWSNSYGDGKFVFSYSTPAANQAVILVWNGYVTIDGQTGGGPGNWREDFGFEVSIPDSTDAENFALIKVSNGISYISLSHIDLKQAGMNNWEPVEDGYNNKQDCILCASSAGINNIHISYCYLHEANRTHIFWNFVSNSIVEYSFFERRQGAPHGEAISVNYSGLNANNIFRYNMFADISGTGIIVIKDSIQSLFYIYGNIFMTKVRDNYYTTNGVICNTGGDTNTHMYVFNNTMINMGGGNTGISWRGDNVTGNIAFNNLWYNCENSGVEGVQLYGYNEYRDTDFIYGVSAGPSDIVDSGNPFTKTLPEIISSLEFGRKNESTPGVSPTSRYSMNEVEGLNKDMFGVTRAFDSVWTIGAIEYPPSNPPDSPPPPAVPPTITSVTVDPNTGTVNIGGTVTITVTAGGNETGLTPSNATFNAKQIVLSDQGNGKYAGTYTVAQGDNDAVNAQATNITLTGPGGTSAPASSSGSTLIIDAHTLPQPPVIASVTLNPTNKRVKIGDTVTITVTAQNNQSGLTPSNATFNAKQIALNDQGNGKYIGTYTVTQGDNDAVNAEAMNITLSSGGGTSTPASSSGSNLSVDAHAPNITSVVLNPNTGVIRPGETVTITVYTAGGESGLAPSNATFVGKSVHLSDQGNGTYSGTYTIQATDSGQEFAPNALFSDGFENGNTNQWTSTSSGIIAGNVAKLGNNGVVYDVQSTSYKLMQKDFGSDYFATYSSFYFKLDADFVMGDGEQCYIMSMNNTQNSRAWSLSLRRSGPNYQIIAANGGLIGNWTTINKGQWYWIKVKHISAVNGSIEWWVDGMSKGSHSGNTSSVAAGKLSGIYMNQVGAGTRGKIYWDHFQVTPTDHTESAVLEATGITVTDSAGNTSNVASSSGSQLTIDTSPPAPDAPTITSVIINPNSGFVKVGGSVSITVTAGNNESGLTPSNATINGKQVTLSGQGNGTYTGIYTVQEGDNENTNVEAINITLTGTGGTSAPASSSGSSLTVDGRTPAISSVTISPDTGTVTVGQSVFIFVTAGGNETGLTASNAMINGRSIPLVDLNNGIYRGEYIVGSGDNEGVNIEATNIRLTDMAGNVSTAASSSGSSLSVDITTPESPPDAPVVASVAINPNSGTIKTGNTVNITVTAANNQAGLTPSNATFNGKQVPLVGQGNGTYTGIYTVTEGDNDGVNVEATNITLTGAGGTSAPAASTGSTVRVDAHKPVITSVVVNPNSGWLRAGQSITITATAAN
ncbi:MAG: hypothetical protein JXB48_21855, partial [Candidatus Latescibacteria bacterium]|nr:hypothetical protein [Candidatus Latescibacterota bacterium]